MIARRRRVALVLGCCGVLALVIGVEARLPLDSSHAPATRPMISSTAANAALPSYEPPSRAAFREIAERPLFVPSRRPQLDAPRATTEHPPLFIVEGTVLSPEHRYAVIQYGKPARRESVPEGGMVDGWRIDSITDASIAVSAGGSRFELPVGDPEEAKTAFTRPN
jgi:hypothetical protein